ncbi:MAG TPA: hypothetical protein RMH99_17745, partial [Sandaracinaceae bacterium LLY-WYZ-13_1]|nr:hypothetical protein [Sandaracinaceae bacterium LLY-WYZ-13_1]
PAPIDPTEVTYGETTFVVVVNPTINDATDFGLPMPGPVRDDVSVIDRDTGVGGPTGEEGVVVLGLPDGGDRRLDLEGDTFADTVEQSIRRQDLVELAVAIGEDRPTSVMRRIDYPFGGDVVMVTPEMGVEAVNDALANSDGVVFLGEGIYEGDLEFAGSNVTLFGAGELGGEVEIVGNVTVPGSRCRIRGARITGDLLVSGSEASVSFSQVDGATTISGSNVVLLQNRFCGAVDVGGDGLIALGNGGLEPLSPEGC